MMFMRASYTFRVLPIRRIIALVLLAACSRGSQSQELPPPITVEELTFDVTAGQRPLFLQNDHQIWTPTLSQQPGFISKETLVTVKSQRTVKILVHWQSERDWHAVPKELLVKTEAKFAKAMGGKDKYRLVSVKAYQQHRFVADSSLLPDTAGAVELDIADCLAEGWKNKTQEITVPNDPTYRTKKRYLGIPLLGLLEEETDLDMFTDATVIFECSDGYRPTMPLSRVKAGGGWLAIRDLDAPAGKHWTPHEANGKAGDFSPSYLVWPDPQKNRADYGWPYGLVKIRIQRKDPFERLAYPRNAQQHEAGYQSFKVHCAKCHAMNGAGGVLGLELNYPKNITEYWQRHDIEQFVRNPQAYRHASKMPSANYLKPKTLNAILNYIEHMATEKVTE